MSLIWDGTRTFENDIEQRPATDENRDPVLVTAPTKVTDDFGWPCAWQAAERMHREGEVTTTDRYTIVRVTAAHCAEIEDDATNLVR